MSFLLTQRSGMPKLSQIREELRVPERHKHTYIPEQLCICTLMIDSYCTASPIGLAIADAIYEISSKI